MGFLEIIFSLGVLIILEIVLGIDNLVFLSVLANKLPKQQRKKARRWGLTFAWVTRLMLLASAVGLAKLTHPLFTIAQFSFSGRDLFLFVGGIFLITKATQEIHHDVGGNAVSTEKKDRKVVSFKGVVVQIALMDIIFSFDSVLTAIGLTPYFWIMAAAITCAILVMIYASESVGQFIEKYPSIKMLALSFLILVGTFLVADSFAFHIPRAYLYFAIGFSLAVEMLNLIKDGRRKQKG